MTLAIGTYTRALTSNWNWATFFFWSFGRPPVLRLGGCVLETECFIDRLRQQTSALWSGSERTAACAGGCLSVEGSVVAGRHQESGAFQRCEAGAASSEGGMHSLLRLKRSAFDVPSSRKDILACLLRHLGLAIPLTCSGNCGQAWRNTEVITDVVVAFASAKILDDDLFEAGGASPCCFA